MEYMRLNLETNEGTKILVDKEYLKPYEEEIVEFLDKNCKLIDSLILEKQQLINKLEEYKQSFIFEYVTGKKEVPK